MENHKMTPEEIKSLSDALQEKVAEGLIKYEDAVKELEAKGVELEKKITALESKAEISLPGVEEENKKNGGFYFSRLLKAQLTGDWSEAGFEKEVVSQSRSMGALSNSMMSLANSIGTKNPPRISELYSNALVLVWSTTSFSKPASDQSPVN